MRAQSVVQLLAEDLDTGESLGTLQRGDQLHVEPGQRVRLRMQTKSSERSNVARYPSTRFVPPESRAIRVERVNDEVGAILFTAQSAPAHRAVIQYEILEDWPIPEREKTGRVYVIVGVDPEASEEEDVVNRRGATLYSDPGFRGNSVRVYDNGLNLSSESMDNAVSSVRLDEGCYAVLYDLPGLGGANQIIRYDVGELNGAVGDDRASSIRVVCDDGASTGPSAQDGTDQADQPARGIVLYRDLGFRGESVMLTDGDYPSLRGTRVDNGTVSSVSVGSGCLAFLYESTDFRGESYEVRQSVSDMRRTPLGNDDVSSVRVVCR